MTAIVIPFPASDTRRTYRAALRRQFVGEGVDPMPGRPSAIACRVASARRSRLKVAA